VAFRLNLFGLDPCELLREGAHNSNQFGMGIGEEGLA
jgi:hypothetical protein